MLYIPTLISIIEVLLVTLPVLLTVAFVTVAERKTMASMQRRLGPNIVGQLNQIHNAVIKKISVNKTYSNTIFTSKHPMLPRVRKLTLVRSYSIYNKKDIAQLYANRKAPVKPFKGNIIYICDNLVCPVTISEFFKKIKDIGGIYMFTYKHDSNIYYIGRTKNFKIRLNSHMKSDLNDRFHIFVKTVGWENFFFSIIEICDVNLLSEKEDYYLQEYLPILNTIFKSNLGDILNYDSLYDKLKLMQSKLEIDNKYKGVPVYLYKCVNGQISLNYTNFTSISKLSNHLGVSRGTISVYLNTYVPFKDHLFLNNIIKDIAIVEKLVSDSTQGLSLNHNVAVKVWKYYVRKDGIIDITTHESIGEVSKILGGQHTHVKNFHLDKWVKGGFNGHYLFTSELNHKNLELLKDFSLERKSRNINIWAYNGYTLELIKKVFTSAHNAALYFNVDYRSILVHMDTNKPTVKNGKRVFFFSRKLSELDKTGLSEKIKLSSNTFLWVYKKVDEKLLLINDKKPTYLSRKQACEDIHISKNTIRKYIDNGKSYKGLYFYSSEI